LHNDDYTPMDFVVMILESIFQKTHEESTHIMLTVHTKGAATCGVFPFAIAELKVKQVTEQAFRYKFPLRCTMEPE